MSRVRHTPHHGTPRTEPDEYTALVNSTDRCDWCCRLRKLDPHHVAQGYRDQTLYEIRLIAFLCRLCHDAIHTVAAEDARSLGLAIVYHAGRGNNVRLMWGITGRKWPRESLVEHWIDRIGRRAKPWEL